MPAPRIRRALAGTAIAASIGVTGVVVAATSPLSAVLAEQASSDDAPSTSEASSATTAPAEPAPPADPADPANPADPAAPDGPGGPGGHGRPQILDDALDELVDEGVITQAQADAIRDRVEQNAQEWRDAHPPGQGGPGGPGGPGGRGGHDFFAGAWETAAEIIGVEPDALRDGLRDGKSIAEIAAAEGVERQAVIDAIVAEAEAHIAEAVDSGWLGEEGAARLRERLPEMAGHLVDMKRP